MARIWNIFCIQINVKLSLCTPCRSMREWWIGSIRSSRRHEMRLTVNLRLRLPYPLVTGPGTICVEDWMGCRPNPGARRGDKFLAPAGTRTTNPRQSQTQSRPILNYSDSF
jgi:hypothetical protein